MTGVNEILGATALMALVGLTLVDRGLVVLLINAVVEIGVLVVNCTGVGVVTLVLTTGIVVVEDVVVTGDVVVVVGDVVVTVGVVVTGVLIAL